MTSPPHLLYNTYYHIYNRGTNGENIFIQERNFLYFLNLYAKYIEPITDTYAYCLLRNHFHILVRIKSVEEMLIFFYSNQKLNKPNKMTPPATDQAGRPTSQIMDESFHNPPPNPFGPLYPSKQFSNFFNAYAKAINAKYGRTGSLFQHPFGRIQVLYRKQFYRVVTYIHQNPQKHGLVEDFRDWKYSSYGILGGKKPTNLKQNSVLDWFDGVDQYASLHKKWIDETISKPFAGEDYD